MIPKSRLESLLPKSTPGRSYDILSPLDSHYLEWSAEQLSGLTWELVSNAESQAPPRPTELILPFPKSPW